MSKKKILLLSDDIRMHSGIATIGRELVLGTADEYDWVQLAGAMTHPDKGKVADMSDATNKLLGRSDCYVKLYPIDGYGDEDTLFAILNIEKPDLILHFTDPRFWTWLYLIEKQIRSKIPLTYLNIWDSLPYPMYNRPFYESCDVLMSISKQTYNINKQVLGPERCISIDGMWDKEGNFLPFNKENNPFNEITSTQIVDSNGNILGNRVIQSMKEYSDDLTPLIKVVKDGLPPERSKELEPVVDKLFSQIKLK